MARYLKTIDLHGFKSFPVKTTIELVDGITGIVGANGSGKSNVVEAIKWVLGEQSAKSLRGDKMEDVIFNGTRDRTPASMAEVSLTFDNENHWLPIDYNEVMISRRMFRSGEGQYSINKSKVRLKDIVELFLDTGIGRDSYAIFEQGKIDRLLSESAMERRVLFEDFAGISKFKFRKEEAEKKLENSRINIERVSDIILGLSKEIESLKGQAENASKYNEWKALLRNLELKFEALRIKNFEKEISDKMNQKRKTEEKLKPLAEELKQKEENIIIVESDIQNRETELLGTREDYGFIEKELGETRTRLENNRDRKTSVQNQLKSMEARLLEGEERRKGLNQELTEKSQEMDQVFEEKERVQDANLDIQSKIDAIHTEIRQLDSGILLRSKELGFEKIISKDDIEKQKHELIAVQTKLETYRMSLEEKWNLSRGIQIELEEKKNQFEVSSRENSKLKSELGKIMGDLELLIQREVSIKGENSKHNASMKELQVKLKSMDKVIMESLEKQAVLLEKFSHQKPLLESNIENVIQTLMDSIQKHQTVQEVKDSIEKLKAFFADYKNSYEKILGILYSDEGAYTRKETIEKEIEAIVSSIQKNEQEIEAARAKILALQAVREDIQNQYNKNDFELANLKNELKKIADQLASSQEAQKVLENQINSLSAIIEKKQSLIEEMLICVDQYDEEIREFKNKRNALFEDLNKKKVDFARVEEKYKSLLNETARIKNQIADIEKIKNTYESDKNNSIAIVEELDKRILDDTKKLGEKTQKSSELKELIEQKKSQIEGLQKSRKALELKRKENEDAIQKLEKTLVNLESAVSERRGFLDSIIENSMKNFGADVRTIQVESADSFENISVEINKIRQDLLNLGDVNLLAIEQYQGAKEKMDFLLTQKQDSEKAIEDIKALIAETNAKCVDQFSSAFEDIRKAFKKIFARLFDGGRADLVMENEEDVLNSGINIFAEPPGKKFQSISLLSGGEKALVAIAVIFAILYLKPTPFVVLDEMDAPLDDDNIERFKSILKDFKQTSQFIIVSHSKSTLEICDALYGVTMEEQGVSKIINVAFDEAELLFKTDEPKIEG
jgi:chromosome segregation protein